MSSGLGPILFLPTGATGTFRATLSRGDGAAISLVGVAAVDFFVTRSAYKADADHELHLELAAGITVVDALAGIVEIEITAEQSADLDPYGAFFYFLRAELASGEVVLPDLCRGAFLTDLTSALNQAANGDALQRLDPPTGEIAATTPDMGNYLLNRHDLTGLTGGAATDLDGLTAATLADLANGARLVLTLTHGDGERIRAEYQLGLKSTDTESAPWIIVCDNDATRCWRLDRGMVTKGGQPCTYNAGTGLWHRVWAVGADGAAAPSLDATGFSIPA